MPEKRRKYDPEFRDGAVRIVRETGKTLRQVADDLGINHQTLANWVAKDKVALATADSMTKTLERLDHIVTT